MMDNGCVRNSESLSFLLSGALPGNGILEYMCVHRHYLHVC